jgi:hypothetical protein
MPIKVKCECGEVLEAPDGSAGRKILCLKCKKSVQVGEGTPAATLTISPQNAAVEKSEKKDAVEHVERPPHCQLIKNEDGTEYWKLTCYCGKRIRTPAKSTHRYGRCPKCGHRMKLPGALHHKQPFLISAQPGGGPVAAPSKKPADGDKEDDTAISPLLPGLEEAAAGAEKLYEDDVTLDADEDIETVTTDAVKGIPEAEAAVSHTAAMKAADKLRPQRHVDVYDSGRISAWPLAGRIHRFLAAFIDLTLAVTISGIVMILASAEILPEIFLTKEILVVMLILSGIFSDMLVQLIWGGSLGKKLVIILVRDTRGRVPGAGRVILRSILKWLLFPGWIIGAIDPQQRTLHDLLCGTLVLRGRSRH